MPFPAGTRPRLAALEFWVGKRGELNDSGRRALQAPALFVDPRASPTYLSSCWADFAQISCVSLYGGDDDVS